MKEKLKWSDAEWIKLNEWILVYAELVEPNEIPQIIREDPADNHILACADAGEADIIVSGDTKHLLPLESWKDIPVISVARFLSLP